MPTYTREVRVEAPFDRVWAFHARTDGLEALTPSFMNLEVEGVTGSDGETDPEVLGPGTRIDLTMRPGGVGPRQTWTSVITDREDREESAWFRDEMEGGPFPQWVHTHRFFADDGATTVHDRVEYSLPVVGGALGPLGNWVGFEPMFRYRHRKTKELLE
jgi:ligand-binding SRPBCC domain-containing protein